MKIYHDVKIYTITQVYFQHESLVRTLVSNMVEIVAIEPLNPREPHSYNAYVELYHSMLTFSITSVFRVKFAAKLPLEVSKIRTSFLCVNPTIKHYVLY